MQTTSDLNAAYSSRRMKRRYEVWFMRLGLANGSGAWWFRYLLMNLGKGGCPMLEVAPVQVWATWFPRDGVPETFIQQFPEEQLTLSARGNPNLEFRVGENFIRSDTCGGHIPMRGHDVSWNLQTRSQFHNVLSDKGWIGFSKTPHSDAVFSGAISFDGNVWRGDALGTGVQGHNCGVRHRHFWTWTHAYLQAVESISTLEILFYEMPLGLTFRKAILWHGGRPLLFRRLQEIRRDDAAMVWQIVGHGQGGTTLEARIEGPRPSTHRLPYFKTDCSGSFEVANNSLARAHVRLLSPGREPAVLVTETGAVLEMTGKPR